jgi:hypothetical protein
MQYAAMNTPTHPICGDAGCEHCLAVDRPPLQCAYDAVLSGHPEAAVHLADGVFIRAEVLVRATLPEVIENIAARQRLEHLRAVS